MRALPLLLLLPLLAPGAGRPFAPYQVIIDRQPFGPMAPDPAPPGTEPAGPAPDFAATEEVQQLAGKLVMSAMITLPGGQTAVGVTDTTRSPSVSHLIAQGDPPVDGITLELVDFTDKIATFSKSGITFSLRLGSGIVETLTPELLARREQQRLAEAAAREPPKPRYNSLAEQIIAMQMSVGPDVEAPPLPIITGDLAALTKPFDPERPPEAPQTETDHLVAQGIEELRRSVEAGETPQQYIDRLQTHQRAEAQRQQQEKKIAAEAEKELLKNARTAADEARIRRRMNIELLKKGVTPLEPITLTPEEDRELKEAGITF